MSLRKYGLEGVQTYDVRILPDERGFFSEALRKDWNELVYDEGEKSDTRDHLAEVIASQDRSQIVRIPGYYWHRTKTVSHKPFLTVYFVTKVYDYENPDEERRPWNDMTIVPTAINGKVTDPRVGKPWDWLYPIHK